MDAGMTLIRRSEPTKFDLAPYGTRYKVFDNHDNYDLYLQVVYNEDEPHWDLIVNFSLKAHPELLQEIIEGRLRKSSLSD
jgi:hypothetical protein